MMYKHYSKIFNILLVTALLVSSFVADVSSDLYTSILSGTHYTDGKLVFQSVAGKEESAWITEKRRNSDIVVGLLKTEEETYLHEVGKSQTIYEMFNNFGIKTVLIDYNKIINLNEIREKSLNFSRQDEILAKKLTLDQIKIEVAQFIKAHKINRIFIPGNNYNLHSEPFPPTPYRQLVTEAIVKIVDDNPSIHLLGVCGGLQGIMYAKGIELTSVANLVSSVKQAESHLKSAPDPQQEDVPLQLIKITPNSRLAEV